MVAIEADERFASAVFAVEATAFEKWTLWERYEQRLRWVGATEGMVSKIGTCDGRPVCVSYQFDTINGKLVLFYDATSQVVDHEMVDEWLDANFKTKWDGGTRRAHCDAMNFHHCMQAIEQSA